MKLSVVYARFYKSFNFDQHRKAHPNATERPWEKIGDEWCPYIEIPVHPKITTVVGANESGKSHLLSAVEKAISGQGFQHQDLCRYCEFFNVERGNKFWPHLGVAWDEVTSQESEMIRTEVPNAPASFTSFLMFREGPNTLDLYFPDRSGGFQAERLEGSDAATFGRNTLPRPFRIQAKVGLPGALPVGELAPPVDGARRSPRAQRRGLIELGEAIVGNWRDSPTDFAQRLPQIAPDLLGLIKSVDCPAENETDERALSFDLARRLLIQLGNVEPQRLRELSEFLIEGEDGHAAALASSINLQLERKLNFPKFWVQDKDFQLVVTPHETELVFTIKDRTGTQYTFDERSAGLKYFLSYFIQSQTHVPDPARSEILLMDEPDAYLSAEAQQDLLKIFGAFAEPDDETRPVQVIYVTHSPFLLDKNHAERIRVLQKGKGSDGTRVIKNASQNHYEPLRSAIGTFVGETAFIGACNLLVEGVADQVLFAGISRTIQRDGPVGEGEVIDLNRLVLVPCGSASHVPYMLYLVRGRDSETPPVLVLLDSDKSGNDAMKLLKDNIGMRKLISSEYLIQIGEVNFEMEETHKIAEPEDLIPVELIVEAANRYFFQISQFRDGPAPSLSVAEITNRLGPNVGVYDALRLAAEEHGWHIDKIGLARSAVEICEQKPTKLAGQIEVFKMRMRKLFSVLNTRRRKAEQEQMRDRAGGKVEQQRKIFERDHPQGATKEQVLFLFERVEEVLDESLDSEAIKNEMLSMKYAFNLDGDAAESVPNYSQFLSRLRTLKDSLTIARDRDGRATVEPPENKSGASPRSSTRKRRSSNAARGSKAGSVAREKTK